MRRENAIKQLLVTETRVFLLEALVGKTIFAQKMKGNVNTYNVKNTF